MTNLLGFNSENGPEWFIVDPTYGQFFENSKFRRFMEGHYPEFSETLLSQGYVRCNSDNVKAYMDGFVYSNAFCSNVDSHLVYKKVGKLLKESGILKSNVNVEEFGQGPRRK